MIKRRLILIAGCLALGGALSFAFRANGSPLQCESIKDADQRHYCRAISIPRPSECELIRNHDLRRLCRAQAQVRPK